MSERYAIENGIPRCERGVLPGRKPKYPFKTMDVGDSFPFKKSEYERVCWAAAQAARRFAMKFEVRRDPKDSRGRPLAPRVWRVK
jgi:hypothetical protein